MRIFGIVGNPLEHSFSPDYFHHKFIRENIDDALYRLFPMEDISLLRPLIKKEKSLCGLNVTIPHKETAIPFMDELDPVVREIGALNVIKINRGDQLVLKGFNTDVIGFEESLKPLLQKQHTHALVFGSGGSSRSVQYVLKKLNIEFHVVSRNAHDDNYIYQDLSVDVLQRHKLLINTTPVGLYPKENFSLPIYYNAISEEHLLYDLIYNPSETLFLQQGKTRGAVVKNGLEMLRIQAEESWKIWNG